MVEVLSESDVMTDVTEKLKEYASKGVENIWLIDPPLRAMYAYRPPTLIEIEGDAISTVDGTIEIPRSEIFAD